MMRQNGYRGTAVPRRASLPPAYPNQRHSAVPQADTDVYDDEWPPRVPNSAIRYTTSNPSPVIVSGNRKYVLHHGLPPQPTASMPSQEQAPRQRRRVHWSLIFGIGMVAMLSLWVVGNMLLAWWNITQDDWHYGLDVS